MEQRFLYRLLSGAFFALLLSLTAYAQGNFVYTHNAGSISGFAVAPNGVLTEIPGSPFPTGEIFIAGGEGAQDNMVVSPKGQFLFVAHGDYTNISAFAIDPSTGSLTPVPGSPFSSGTGLGATSLAVSPDGRLLFAATTSGFKKIGVFAVSSNGALTAVAGSPFSVEAASLGRIRVSSDSRFLAAALDDNVTLYKIAASGALTLASASQPIIRGGFIGLDVDCGGSFVFASDLDRLHVFPIPPKLNGPLVEKSSLNKSVGVTVLLSPNNRLLFTTGNHLFRVVQVASDGSLTEAPGSPYILGDPKSDSIPEDLTTNQAGTLLYTANDDGTLSVYAIGTSGALTPVPGSPFANHNGFGVSIAAFPPATCQTVFDVCIRDNGGRTLLRFNSTTGAYQFTRCGDGFTLTGKGQISSVNSLISLSDSAADRRIRASFNSGQKTGYGTVWLTIAPGVSQTLIINDTASLGQACTCGASR